MKFMFFPRKMIVIFSNVFCMRWKESVYVNIKEESNVIEASFKEEKCNLL
jgi:hypothetical protein